ncbi:hypothetical protein H9Q69_005906 [Fusarium xylarioides]|uniref:Uncharacterized protein n=1 Tax=Fusarium xylarioides TaxID=221167 RepID=A0A9P7IKL9_9HYPO|nr:hypothetical protein H9Q70_002429 [Fusarium xylarioides]KAG5769794.1 hypothetical protein H9Q72_003076 [Fusarium xylarioides]KAG5784366.1 hypothetical protein H9Q73_001978 [Fusarium xylarioides]KAG5795063.1 hypothetical protein H9Q69_005906 [Fusarium xylarioides]KAG5810398.1 hypothetical protein H9Q71_005513 [Fusarium xylarioides]
MKVFFIAAVALVSSSVAAPATDTALVKKSSHLVDTIPYDGLPSVKVDLDALRAEQKAGQTATTNVKIKRSSKAKPKKKTSKKPSAKASVKKTKSGKKLKTTHSKRLLKSSSTGFKNGQDLVDSLDSLVAQITTSGDRINGTLLRVQAGTETRTKGTTDALKEIIQIRAAVSGALTRLSTTKNLKLTSDQRADVLNLVEDLIQEILDIVNDLLETLGLKLSLKASLNPLMNMLNDFLGGLAVTDGKLTPELRSRLGDLIRAQINGDDTRGFDALGSGIENPLLRLHGSLKTSAGSN